MTRPTKFIIWAIGAVSLCVLLGINWAYIGPYLKTWYNILSDPIRIKTKLEQWGPAVAPLAFIGLQVGQVAFAPIPGEASGLVGGYLFGTAWGFVYSTIGLSLGSMLSFGIARVLGERFVRKWIPKNYLTRFDAIAQHEGVILFSIFFLLPGFPKDHLCLFLGLTRLPWKMFIPMATIGRMPGTLILSLQGARMADNNYLVVGLLVAFSLVLAAIAYHWRKGLYAWVDRQAGKIAGEKNNKHP